MITHFPRLKVSMPIAAALVLAGAIVTNPTRVSANDGIDQAKVQIGFNIAPVPLKLDNLKRLERNMVGYGSYLVNGSADCNGCHSLSPQAEYAAGGSPFFSQTAKVNADVYLGGGYSFGNLPAAGFAEIITRNLTPDKDGRPAGLTLTEFLRIFRTGIDLDKWHPTCTGAPNGHCLPAPFDGSLLQIMPWPVFQNMTETDLMSIYAYLSAIPCLEGDPGNPKGADTKGTRCQ